MFLFSDIVFIFLELALIGFVFSERDVFGGKNGFVLGLNWVCFFVESGFLA